MRTLDPLVQAWSARTVRERYMLGVMAALAALTLGWLLLLRPLAALADTAADRRAMAEIRLQVLQDLPAAPAIAPPPGGLEPILRASAEAQGLSPALAMSQGGGLGFRLEQASAPQVLDWLAQLQAETGAKPSSLTILKADQGVEVVGCFGASGACFE